VTDPMGDADQPMAAEPERAPDPTPEQPVQKPRGTRRRRLLIAGAGGLVVVLAAAIVISMLVVRANSDRAKIQKLVDNFASAVDQGDQARIVSLLCAEEAAAVTDGDDYDPSNKPGPAAAARRAVRTSEIRVAGSVASAQITRPDQPVATLHFRKEAGVWKVCATAADQVSR
jgi:hypothetical protein